MAVSASALDAIANRQAQIAARFRTQFLFSPVFRYPCEAVTDGEIAPGRISCVASVERVYPYEEIAAADVPPDDPAILRYERFGGVVLEGALPRDKSRGVYVVIAQQPVLIADQLLGQHAHEGLVRLPALEGMTGQDFENEGINHKLFGDDPLLTLAAQRRRLQLVMAKAQGVPLAVAQAIARALETAERTFAAEIRQTHAEIDNPAHPKKAYDHRDMALLSWLEITPRHEALDMLATAHLAQAPPPLPPAALPFDPNEFSKQIASGLRDGFAALAVELPKIVQAQLSAGDKKK